MTLQVLSNVCNTGEFRVLTTKFYKINVVSVSLLDTINKSYGGNFVTKNLVPGQKNVEWTS